MRFNPEKVFDGGKKRLTLLLPARTIERLSWLMKATEAPNITEVIRTALYTYAILVEARAKGAEIRQQLPDGSTVPLEIMIDVRRRHVPPHGTETRESGTLRPMPA